MIFKSIAGCKAARWEQGKCTIAPASVSGSTITIRKFRKDPYSLIDLVKFNSIGETLLSFGFALKD